MTRLKKSVLALTTHFRLPHEGMEAFEVLSRGSAMLARQANNHSKLHVLTCAHVACPWLYPTYYPHEWLQYVDEAFVRHKLALREIGSGTIAWEIDLEPTVAIHSTRDLAALELQGADKDILNDAFDLAHPVPLLDSLQLDFYGHTQPNEESVVPQSIHGSFFWLNPTTKQAFAKSDSVLEQGMCGGAAVATSTGDAIGLIEGIVPVVEGASAAYKALENQVGLIPRDDLSAFVKAVEAHDEDVSRLITGTGLIFHG